MSVMRRQASEDRVSRKTPRLREPLKILAPYTTLSWYQRHRRLCLSLLWAFCSFYGLVWAVAGQFALPALMGPIVVIFFLVIWLLPEVDSVPERWLRRGLFIYLIALLCWPDYIALALPGLPWITAIRLVGPPLALLMLICLSMSRELRERFADILSACPVLWKSVTAFAIIAMLSIGLSSNPGTSMSKFVVAQINWTGIFFLSCLVFTSPGMVDRLAKALWLVTVFTCLIGLWEAYLERVPWAGHIPSFLVIEDESVQRALSATGRAGSDQYRVKSKFGTSLGLAEFLSLSTPFVIHYMVSARKFTTRVLAFLTMPMIVYVVHLTDSRLAAIGLFISLALYMLIWGMTKWRHSENSVLGAVVTLAYPMIFTIMMAATIFVPRIRVEIWGDGSQQASTDARTAMYESGIPMIFSNPLGYGIGQGAEKLGYRNPGGVLTIDTYYLATGLEFGIIGFLVYYGMHLYAIGKSVDVTMRRGGGEFVWLGPIAIALFNFVVSKSVFSNLENHPLVFMFLGVVTALAYRAQQEGGGTFLRPAEKPVIPPAPVNTG